MAVGDVIGISNKYKKEKEPRVFGKASEYGIESFYKDQQEHAQKNAFYSQLSKEIGVGVPFAASPAKALSDWSQKNIKAAEERQKQAAENFAREATKGDGFDNISTAELKKLADAAYAWRDKYGTSGPLGYGAAKGYMQYNYEKADNPISGTADLIIGRFENDYKDEKSKYESIIKAYENRLNAQKQFGYAAKYNNTNLQNVLDDLEKQKSSAKTKAEKEEIENDIKGIRESLYGKSNALDVAGKAVYQGMAQFDKSLAATLDFTLGNVAKFFGWKNNPVSLVNQWTDKELQKAQEATAKASYAIGDENMILGNVASGVTAAIPDLVLAFATGGSSLGAGEVSSIGTKIPAATSLLTNTIKNPLYWTSFAREVGVGYEEAKKAGASDEVATIYTLLTGTVNSLIEIGGGIETLPGELAQNIGSKAKMIAWIKNALDEGKEEIFQDIVENLNQKIFYAQDKPWVSTTDENAVINPARGLTAGAYGAAVGAILGGATMTFDSIINAKSNSALKAFGNIVQAQGLTEDILSYARNSGGENLNALVNEYKANKSPILLGMIYQAACRDIDYEINGTELLAMALDNYEKIILKNDSKAIAGIASSRILSRLIDSGIDEESAKYMQEGIYNDIRPYKEFAPEGAENAQQNGESFEGVENQPALPESTERTEEVEYLPESELPEENRQFAEMAKEGIVEPDLTDLIQRKPIIQLAHDLGYKIRFQNNIRNKSGGISNGYIDRKNKVIVLNPNTKKAITWTLKHELSHSIEQSKFYKKFVEQIEKSKVFRNWLIEKTGLSEDATDERLRTKYKEMVQNARPKEALGFIEKRNETVADFVGDVMFSGDSVRISELLNSLGNEKQSFIDIVKDFFSKLKNIFTADGRRLNEINRLEKAFLKAANEEIKNPATMDGVRHSIDADTDIEEKNIANGTKYLNAMIEEAKVSENPESLVQKDAMYRSDIGQIDFVWGKPGKGEKLKRGYGLSHIIAKHGISTAEKAIEVIAKATDLIEQGNNNTDESQYRLKLYYDGHTVILSKGDDANHWLLTAWENEKETGAYAAGEGDDSLGATAATPTLTRRNGVNTTVSNDNVSYSSETVKEKIDADYLRLAENPEENRAELEKMVEEAAKEWGATEEDGKPIIFYHGTDQDFTVFDRTKGRSNMDIQGMFFSPWELDAKGYGPNVGQYYLNIKNPASEAEGYKALNKFKGQNNAGTKAREYLISLGYDGVNNSDEEIIAFYPEQIKSSDPVTYDDEGKIIPLSERFSESEDIRYSTDTVQNDESENEQTEPTFEDIIDQYERGEISRKEFLKRMRSEWVQRGKEFGTIPEGENASADYAVPKAVDKSGRLTRRFIRTILEKGNLTKKQAEALGTEVLLGKHSYDPISNKADMKYANKVIEAGEGEERWNAALRSPMIGSKTIAIGEQLLADAAEANDTLRVLELSAQLADVLTRAGQTVQAGRMLKKMTGVGRLVTLQRFVHTLNENNQVRYGEDFPVIKVDENLASDLANAKNPEEVEAVSDEIMQNVADQTVPTWLDKWNAWRYTSMLANVITHVRNVVGNAIFIPTVRVSDSISALMEQSLAEEKRTKSFLVKKEYMDFAKADGKSDDVQSLLKGEQKYLESNANALRDKQKIFKTEWLEKLRKGTFGALEWEDMIFKNIHYQRALAGYLQARKVDLKNVDPQVLNDARAYAVEKANKYTYNDASAMANFLSKLTRINSTDSASVKVLKFGADGILPFKRTPVNIIRRGLEYNPLGLLKTLTKGLYDVNNGKITTAEFIDGLSSNLTGSAVFALGWLLSALGLVSAGFDDDKEDKFKQLNGEQQYSINILGKSYTVDWAVPACIPFFIGAEVANAFSDSSNFRLSNLTEPMMDSLEPVINLSMLSGLQNTLDASKYAKTNQRISATAESIALNYAMQGVPSAFGALARTIDPTQRTWYTDKNAPLDGFSQDILNNLESKIPGISYLQSAKVDEWGRVVTMGGTVERIAENFLSPGKFSNVQYDDVNREIKELGERTGESSVYPSSPKKSVKVGDKTKYLSAKEYEKYSIAKGELSFDYVEDFINSDKYNDLRDEQRVDVIDNLYKYANAKAKSKVSDYDYEKEYKTLSRIEKNGGSVVDYYIRKSK